MEYFKILKRAWKIVKSRPYLWLLGLLAGGGGGYSYFGSQFSPGSFNQFNNGIEKEGGKSKEVMAKLTAMAKEGNVSQEKFWQSVESFITSHWSLVIVLGIALFIILILLFILSVSSRGGLIKTVADIEKKDKKSSFFASLKRGYKYFWLVFLTSLAVFLIGGVVIAIISFPIALSYFFQLGFLSVIWAFFVVLLAIPLVIFLGIWSKLAVRTAVLEDKNAVEAVRFGFTITKERLKEVFLVWLVNLGINAVGGAVLGIVVLIYILLVGGVCFLLGLAWLPLGVVLGVLGGIVFLVGILAAAGFISSLSSSYWTLSFLTLSSSSFRKDISKETS